MFVSTVPSKDGWYLLFSSDPDLCQRHRGVEDDPSVQRELDAVQRGEPGGVELARTKDLTAAVGVGPVFNQRKGSTLKK